MDECSCSWKWLCDSQRHASSLLQSSSTTLDDTDDRSFSYNALSYDDYQNAWRECEELDKSSNGNDYVYDETSLSTLFKPDSSLDNTLLKRIESDTLSIVNACLSPLGYSRFSDLVSRMERLLICILGHHLMEIRYFGIVLLNCLYGFSLRFHIDTTDTTGSWRVRFPCLLSKWGMRL